MQSLSRVWLYDPMDCSMPGFPVHHQHPEFTQTHVHRVGDAIQPSYPLCPLLLPPSVFPSIRVFPNESVLRIRWPSASVLPMNIHDWSPLEWTGWISLQSKGLVKSLLQHRSSKASILQCSAFFIVQLSHPYMTLCNLILIMVGLISETQQPALQSQPRTGGLTPALHRVSRGHACPIFLCPALDRNAVLLKADEG